jgi:Skp family chaperone for outer membrane proteins
VKRTVIILTGLATLGVVVYLGSRLHAQSQGQLQQTNATAPAAALRTRIAVVNLLGVVKNYRKWQDFENNYKNCLKEADAEFDKIKSEGLRLKADLEKAADDATRDKIQQQLKALDRQVQDKGEKFKRELLKYRDDMAVQIYREIEDAVKAYARANDIDMVMHYNDAVVPADIYHPLNVQRKLQNPACMPIYVAPGMDITNHVSEMLNARLGAGAPTPGHQ